jgi:hypothetical protein
MKGKITKSQLIFVGVLIVAISSVGVVYGSGVGPDDYPYRGGDSNPPDLKPANASLSASYNSSAETVTIHVDAGTLTAQNYDFVEIRYYPGGDYTAADAKLRTPAGDKHLNGVWAASSQASLTSFLIERSDEVIILTVDDEDDDGDGIAGIEDDDHLQVTYGVREDGNVRQATLVYWRINNETITRETP